MTLSEFRGGGDELPPAQSLGVTAKAVEPLDAPEALVMKGGHYANYSFKSLPGQTTWAATGDIVNNFNVAVSTAVLATTPTNLMVFYVQQW